MTTPANALAIAAYGAAHVLRREEKSSPGIDPAVPQGAIFSLPGPDGAGRTNAVKEGKPGTATPRPPRRGQE